MKAFKQLRALLWRQGGKPFFYLRETHNQSLAGLGCFFKSAAPAPSTSLG
jgi:hypothetical protein